VTPLPGKAIVFSHACRKPLRTDAVAAIVMPPQFVKPIVMKSSQAT
jgi:hypothetical protein